MPQDALYDQQIRLTLSLRLNQLQAQWLPSLSATELEEALWHIKWSEGLPPHLSQMIDDILSITPDSIVAYLARKAVLESRKQHLSDYSVLLGGEA
jgi:hypothetical protein